MENNIVILEMLNQFLLPDDFTEEGRSSFFAARADNSGWAELAEDRKPRIVSLAASLAYAPRLDLFSTAFDTHFREERAHLAFPERWRLSDKRRELSTDWAILLEFYCRLSKMKIDDHLIHKLLTTIAVNTQKRLDDIVEFYEDASRCAEASLETLTDDIHNYSGLKDVTARAHAECHVRPIFGGSTALIERGYLKKFLEQAGSPPATVASLDATRREFWEWYKNSIIGLYSLYLFGRCETGRKIQKDWLQEWIKGDDYDRDMNTCETLCDLWGRANEPSASAVSDVLCRVGTLACGIVAMFMSMREINSLEVTAQYKKWVAATDKLATKWLESLRRIVFDGRVFQMDAAGWALLIRCVQAVAKGATPTHPDINPVTFADGLAEAWASASTLRTKRETLLTGAGQSILTEQTRIELENLSQMHLSELEKVINGIVPDYEVGGLLSVHREKFSAASFLKGPRVDGSSLTDEHGLEVPVIGVLRIHPGKVEPIRKRLRERTPTDPASIKMPRKLTIVSDDRGYNKLFMVPVARVLDMYMPDLHRLRGLLGDDDRTVMDLIGRAVVIGTYERNDNGSGYRRVGFEKTSFRVMTALMKPNFIESGHGFIHILRMLRGDWKSEKEKLPTTEHRIVLRVATSRHREPDKTKETNDPQAVEIQFMFADISSAVGEDTLCQLDQADKKAKQEESDREDKGV